MKPKKKTGVCKMSYFAIDFVRIEINQKDAIKG